MAMSTEQEYRRAREEQEYQMRRAERERMRRAERERMIMPMEPPPWIGHIKDEFYRRLGDPFGSSTNTNTPNPKGTLTLIKKSIREIKAEAVGEKAQGRIQAKINRLQNVGATAQAAVLDAELRVRVELMRVQEWKYKVLPYEAIKEYESSGRNWDGNGGRIKVHIDPLETYCGVKIGDERAAAKDKIIPDNVLDKIEEAKDRQVFEKFHVLWIEKVKDPLLLGSIDGCEDFFLIAEWGEDVSFDDIMKK